MFEPEASGYGDRDDESETNTYCLQLAPSWVKRFTRHSQFLDGRLRFFIARLVAPDQGLAGRRIQHTIQDRGVVSAGPVELVLS